MCTWVNNGKKEKLCRNNNKYYKEDKCQDYYWYCIRSIERIVGIMIDNVVDELSDVNFNTMSYKNYISE